jgi:hypothetical protein
MTGIRVEIHEPVNVLSTMLLALRGPPLRATLHPIAAKAREHLKPFGDHPSIAWLKEFYRPDELTYLYGHVAQLSGPLTFVPQSLILPESLQRYEMQRMKELPAKMSAFYRDAKLGTFRRQLNAEYTLAAADVKDALERSRIEEFLLQMYGAFPYQLVVVPVPTHPNAGSGTGAITVREDYAFLHPPRVPPDSDDPVSWSLDPERTQVLVQRELSRALLEEAMQGHKNLVSRMREVLRAIPRDAPLVRSHPAEDLQFKELFLRGSSASYLRRTRGDEAAARWMEDQIKRTGAPLLRSFFQAIEEYLTGTRWKDLGGFLSDLPNTLRA